MPTCWEPSDDIAYGLWSKMLDWMDWLGDTPLTVMTTRAPAMLKIGKNEDDKFKYRCYQEEEKNKKWGSRFKHISFVHPLLFWYILKWCVILKFGYLWEVFLVVECKSWSRAPNQLCFDTSAFVAHTLEFIRLQPQSQAGKVKKRKKVFRRYLFVSLSLCWLSCNVLDLECQNINNGIPPPLHCVKYEFLKR